MWRPTVTSDELMHHGILGMKWGVRRYQNPDGTLTVLGRKHLQKQINKDRASMTKEEKEKAYQKSVKEYEKATDYADKHHVDYDAYLDEDLRKEYLKEKKNSKKARAVIEYSRLTDLAESKENEYYAEVGKKVTKRILEKYGQEKLDLLNKISTSSSDSRVTKNVKKDFMNLSDDEFIRKYKTTKDVYYKRVQKYGDPYMKSPLAKVGKTLSKAQREKKSRR